MSYQKRNFKIPFTIAAKRTKYSRKNLTKEVKHLYSENYKTLTKETEDDTNKWKLIFSAHGLEELILLKMSILPKVIYRFTTIPINISMTFFYRTRINNCILYVEPQKTLNSQGNLEK